MNALRLTYLFWASLAALLFGAGRTAASASEPTTGDVASPPVIADETEPTQPYCGISVSPLDPVLTAQLPDVTEKGRGVVVANVMKGSPADKAGLKQYDIVLSYDQQDIYSPEQLVKLVRNDRPGREISLRYVRGGKLKKATLTLGEMPTSPEVRSHAARRPLESFGNEADRRELKRQHTERERDRQNDPQPWATFESLTISKLADGRYQAKIEFRDADSELLHREYTGTRDDIRQAIQKDKDLPEDERQHLLRSLDQQAPLGLPFAFPRAIRDWLDLDREFFHWPHLDF